MEAPSDTAASAVFLVGDGERLAPALESSLARHGVAVTAVPVHELAKRAYVSVPDLVVAIGDAAEDMGRAVVRALAKQRATASIPVLVVVQDPGALSDRLDAFKHGVVAMIPRSASADEMATRIADVVREVPDRSGEVHRGLAEASVDELVELFAKELRTGILSVAAGPDDVSAQVVLHAEKPVQQVVSELVDRLRPLVSRAKGPLRYEFFESTADRLGALMSELGHDADVEVFKGMRIVLVEQRAARSDALAQELRGVGARVVVADGAGVGLDRAVGLDPQVILFDGAGEEGWALGALRFLRRDPRLRWASVLVAHEAQLWCRPDDRPDLAALAASVAPLTARDGELSTRAQRERSFEVRLETVGPTRLLRALAGTQLGLQVRVTHPSAVVEIDLADGLIAGAMARRAGGPLSAARGPAALATLLALSSGRVRIERKDAPSRTDVMAPIDDALAAASSEKPLIAPSIPPPSQPPEEPAALHTPGISVPNDNAMVARLEGLIGQLSRIVEQTGSLRPPAPLTYAYVSESAPSTDPAVTVPSHRPSGNTGQLHLPPGGTMAGVPASAIQRPPPAALPGSRRRPRPHATLVGIGVPDATSDSRGGQTTRRERSAPPPPPPQALATGRPPGSRSAPPPPRTGGTMRTAPPPPPKGESTGRQDVRGFRGPSGSPEMIARASSRGVPTRPPPPPPAPRTALGRATLARGPRSAPPPPPPSRPPPSRPPASRPPASRPPASKAPSVAPPARSAPPPPPGRPASVSPAAKSAPPPPPPTTRIDKPPRIAPPPPPLPSFALDAASASAFASTPPERDPGDDHATFASESFEAESTAVTDFSASDAGAEPFAPFDDASPAAEPSVEIAHPMDAAGGGDPFDAPAAYGPSPLAGPVIDEPTLPRSRLPLLIGGAVAGVVVIGLVATVLVVASSGGESEDGLAKREAPSMVASAAAADPAIAATAVREVTAPPDDGDPTHAAAGQPDAPPTAETATEETEATEATEATEEATEETETPTPPAPRAPAAGAWAPLAESAPLEGTDADLSLAAMGIEPVEETSRRRRRQLTRSLIRRANLLWRRHRLDEAEAHYRRILALDSEDARATVGLCRIAMAREQPVLAIRLAQRLVRLRPAYPANWVLLGDTFEEAGDDRAALRAWTHAHDIDPRWRPAAERLARVRTEGE